MIGGTPGTPLPMSYDTMGNLVNDGLGMSLAYDATGRLTTAIKSAAQFTAGYNALGQRVTKTSTGTSAAGTRLYARDETGRPLGVYVVDSSVSNGYRVEEEYIHLDSWRPVAVVRPDPATGMANPKVFPILTDHLGTPRKVLDGDTGQTRWAWDAKQPFGHELPNEIPTAGLPAFTLDLRFPGQRFDEETGLFHNGFRDYHPGLGRYVQSDPLGLGAGWNTFSYVKNEPLSLIDPMGLEAGAAFRSIYLADGGNPESPSVGFHNYDIWIPLCSLNCSEADAFNAMRNFSAPGAPPAINGSRNLVLPGFPGAKGNPINQTVDPCAKTITNVALPGHQFGGSVTISIQSRGSDIGARIVGTGTGPSQY